MTTSVAVEVGRRKGRTRTEQPRQTMAGALADALRARLELATTIRFPSPRYADDPLGFCREILGVELWSRQIDIMLAVRDHDRVAVKSGRRVSKSHSIAILALWWYCTRDDARVILSSTTARQVDAILWRELAKIRSASGRCVAC